MSLLCSRLIKFQEMLLKSERRFINLLAIMNSPDSSWQQLKENLNEMQGNKSYINIGEAKHEVLSSATW